MQGPLFQERFLVASLLLTGMIPTAQLGLIEGETHMVIIERVKDCWMIIHRFLVHPMDI